jgi:putative oxidoreductase
MIVFHGWEKLMTARRQFHTFPNLIGIGSELSYVLVVWLEVFGAALIALGLLTRWHALGLAFTLFIAWLLWHQRRFTGTNAGEMAFAYMFGYLLLFLTGAGRYSLDHWLGL